jgi:hypothetical protein
MKVIGHGYRMRGLNGYHLITMESGSLRATGMAITAGLSITTAGIGSAKGIMTGAATGAMTTITTTSSA